MKRNVIFCFSGTGNCLDLAQNIARGLGNTDIILMRKAPAITDVREAERVGFVFPCYGGGAPKDVLDYANSISGGLRLVALQDSDILIKRPESFALATGVHA